MAKEYKKKVYPVDASNSRENAKEYLRNFREKRQQDPNYVAPMRTEKTYRASQANAYRQAVGQMGAAASNPVNRDNALYNLARQTVDDRERQQRTAFQNQAAQVLGLTGRPISSKGIQDAINRNNYNYKRAFGTGIGEGIRKNIAETRGARRNEIANIAAENAKRQQAEQKKLAQDRIENRKDGFVQVSKTAEPIGQKSLQELTAARNLNDRKDGAVAIQKRQPNLNGYVPEENTYEQISQDPDFNLYKLKGKTSFYDPDYQAGIDRLFGASPVDYMTQEQKDTYNYIYGRYGRDAVKEYERSILPELNRMMQEDITERTYEESKNNPLKGLGLDLANAFWAPRGAFESAVNVITGQPIDTNSRAFIGTNASAAAHQGIMDRAKETFGDNVFTDVIGEGVLGMAENASRYPLGAAGLTFMGMQAASSGIKDAKDRGATDEQALAVGVTNGIVEYLTEEVSLGNLEKVTQITENPIRTAKDFAKAVAFNFGVEASEEMASEVLDTAADLMIMQGNSQTMQRYNGYLGQGMTEGQAKLATFTDFMKDVAYSGVVGGVTGAGMAGTAGLYNLAMSQNQANNINQLMTADMARQGMMPTENPTQMLQNLARESEQAQQGPSLSEVNRWASSEREDPKNYLYEWHREASENLSDTFEGEEGKKAFEKIPLTERTRAYRSFMDYYNLGYHGTEISEEKEKRAQQVLNFQQMDEAMKAGALDAQTNYPGQQVRKIEESAKNVKIAGTPEGTVTYDKSRYQYWTSAQKLRVNYVGAMVSKVFGIDVHFFESVAGEDGKFYERDSYFDPNKENREAKNGSFYVDKATGRPTITLDINAGMFRASDWTGDISDIKTIFPIVSHEMTHYLEQFAPEHYKALSDAVVNSLVKNKNYTKGLTLNQMIREQRVWMETHEHQKYSNDDALREIVARACEDMLSGNADAVNAFEGLNSKTKRYIWEHVKKIFDNLHDFFAQMLGSYESRSAEAKAIRQNMEEFERIRGMWQEALGFATENLARQDAVRAENISTEAEQAETAEKVVPAAEVVETNGQDGETAREAFSIRQFAQALDFDLRLNAEGLPFEIIDPKTGKAVKKVTEEHMRQTPMGYLIEAARQNNTIDEETADKQLKMFADLMNLTLKYDSASTPMVWEIAGSMMFSSVKSNADAQYATTVDYGTICAKTQGLIDVLSKTMVEKGRGLTRKEVIDAYNATAHNGLSVPCPVCYVFSRWMGVPSLLETMRQCQVRFENASEKEVKKYINTMLDRYGDAKGVNSRKTALQNQAAKLDRDLQAAMQKGDLEEQRRIEKKCDQLEKELRDVESFNWVTQVRCISDKKGGYKLDPSYKSVPNEILLDLTRTGDFASKYAKSWKYRVTRGAGMGKAIMPYSGATIGDFIKGNKTKWEKAKNVFFKKDIKAAKTAVKRANTRAKAQNLIGGQRFQSTSDFRAEWGIDYLMTFLECQAAGSQVQLYTKVIEAVDMFATAGAEVNLSIMPKDNGYVGNKLVFSDVTGINFNEALKKTRKYDNVQMILVGINDKHIRLALKDKRISFVIPWHPSGSSKETLSALMTAVNENLSDAKSYEDSQNDKIIDNSEEMVKMRKLREDILMRNIKTISDEQQEMLDRNPWLNDLYRRFYLDKTAKEYGVKLNKKQISSLFPYEYWDTSLTIEDADENGRRFQEYCASLGYQPRFSQFANDEGYWKLLIDRRMYNNDGTYHDPKAIDVTNVKVSSIPQAVNSNNYKDVDKIAQATRDTLRAIDNEQNDLEVIDEEETNREQYSSSDSAEYKGSEHEVDANTIEIVNRGKVQYSERISDPDLVAQLEKEIENGDYITTYKAMQLIDGKLYPPMAAKTKGKDGKYHLTNASELGVWQRAVEDPTNIKIKNGKGYYTLNKGNGKSIDAAYNPYEHSSNLVLNDQFEEAYNRTNIVTVECVIPKSEIDNPYRAEYAKDATGILDWKAGTVAGKLKNNRRMVYLSRYLKPVRILNESEVAKMWKETLGDSGISVPFNVVTPQLREALEAEGVKIDYEGSPTYRSRNKTQYSSRDSDGNELTEGQQEYFANSKVRDRKGNLVKVYHGGTVENIFDTGRGAGGDTEFGPGAYFTDSEYYAKEYTEYRGGKVKEYYINLTNPYDNRKKFEDGPEWDKVKGILTERYGINDKDLRLIKNWGMKTMQEVIDRYTGTKQRGFFTNVNEANAILREAGYDGVIAEYNDVLQYVVFNPNQAKLTTNQNPTENVDIRYSSREDDAFSLWQDVVSEKNDAAGRDSVFFLDEDDPTKVTYQQQEYFEEMSKTNDTIKAMNAALHQAIGEGKKVDVDKFAEEQAKKLRRSYGSKTAKGDLTEAIRSLCEKMNAAIQKDANDIAVVASNIGREVMQGIIVDDDTMRKQYPNLKRELKTYRILPGEKVRADMAAAYDSYEAFRRRAFGNLTIVGDDAGNFVRVDTVYQELNEKYPELFPDDIQNESEMMLRIMEVAQEVSGKKVTYTEAWGTSQDNLDEMSYMIGQDILNDYYTAAGTPAFGGVLESVRNDLIKQHKAEMKEAFAEKNRTIRDLRERLRNAEGKDSEKIKARLEALRNDKNNQLARMQQRYEQKMEKIRERRNDREARTRLLKAAQRLAKLKGGPEFEARKAALIGDLDLIAKGIGKDTEKKLQELKAQAERLRAEDENYAQLGYEKAKAVFERLSKKRIADMTGRDVADLTERIVELTYMQYASKRLHEKDIAVQVATAGKRIIAQQRIAKGINGRNAIGSTFGRYTLNMLNPTRAMARLDGYQTDGVLTKLGKALNDGQTKENEFMMRASKKFNTFLDAHPDLVKTWYQTDIDTGFKGEDGKPIYINKGMRISLYLHSLNYQNRNHIATSGINIPDAKLYMKGKYSEAYRYHERLKLQPTDIKRITDGMTADEKAFANLAHEFLNVDTKDAINETSMVLNGTYKATVDNYFPIKTDPNFVMGDITGLIKDGTIEGWGALKERKQGASKQILLEDVAQVLQRQAQNTARYYGLAIPVRDFNKVMKWQEPNSVADKNTSVGEAIQKTWGSAAFSVQRDNEGELGYIQKMLQDIQTGASGSSGPGSRLFSSLKSTYAGTVLNWNIGVSIKQSASAPFAAVVLDTKSIAKAFAPNNFFRKADLEYMDSITPWSYMRRQGMSGTEMGEVYKPKNFVQKSEKLQKFKQKTNFIQAVDVWTTNRLFFATEYYVQDHFPNLEKRGPEYNKKVAELYNDMLQRTQPSYDVMQRNAFLRSDSPATKVFGMFKTQTFNMGGEVIDAWGRLTAFEKMHKDKQVSDAQLKKVRGQFGRTVGATIASQLMLAALGVLAKAVYHNMKNYRDDKGEVTPESTFMRAIYEFLTSFSGMTMGGSEAQSFFLALTGKEKWYDMEYPGLSTINDFMTNSTKVTENFRKACESGWKADDAEKFRNSCAELAMSAAILGRIPADNIYKLANALYLHVQDIKNGDFGKFEAGESLLGLRDSSVTKDQYAQRAAAAYAAGDTAAGDQWAEKTTNKKLQAAMYGDLGIDEDSSKAMVAYVKDGGNATEFERGQALAKELEEKDIKGDEVYAYVVGTKDYTNQEKIAWFKSSTQRTDSKKYTAWKDAGYGDWDFLKYRSDLSRFSGDGKQDKIVNYIKTQTADTKKRKALWMLAGYKESSFDKNMN